MKVFGRIAMSGKAARFHTNPTNRHQTLNGGGRKAVYRSVLENPFQVHWPNVSLNVQNAVLERVISMLDGVAQYTHAHERESRKRKWARLELVAAARKRIRTLQKESQLSGSTAHVMRMQDIPPASLIPPRATPPPIFQHLTVGINKVTRLLEEIATLHRKSIATTEYSPDSTVAPLILVCRADIDPPVLVGHLPHLVAACNSSQRGLGLMVQQPVKLVPLAKGAEAALAEAFGLRRVSVVAINGAAPQLAELRNLLDAIPTLTAPWLVPPSEENSSTLVPTHIKQLRTSAPTDMKATKAKRVQAKASAKAAAKERLLGSRNNKRVTVISTE